MTKRLPGVLLAAVLCGCAPQVDSATLSLATSLGRDFSAVAATFRSAAATQEMARQLEIQWGVQIKPQIAQLRTGVEGLSTAGRVGDARLHYLSAVDTLMSFDARVPAECRAAKADLLCPLKATGQPLVITDVTNRATAEWAKGDDLLQSR